MSPVKSVLSALALAAVSAGPASAQVAFVPVVQAFPNGVGLSATPVVSADRRYVRLGITPQFTGLEGFDTYSVPAAVSGGGGGLRSVGVPVGMNGPDPNGYGYALNPGDPASASAFLSGGAGYPDRPRLSAGLAGVPRPKAARPSSRAKKRRPARGNRP